MADIEELRKYATKRQFEILKAIHDHGSQRAAASALNVNHSVISRSMNRLRHNASKQGYAPEYDLTHPVPEAYTVAGVSSLYDADGNIKLQWVKSASDKKKLEAMQREAMEAFCEEIPRAKAVAAKGSKDSDLLNLYVVTDYHLGLKSWHEETGEDWDLQIAEDLIYKWLAHAVEMSPSSEVGLLAQLGDFIHFDTMDAVTPTNKHQLDADTRIQKIVRIAIRIYRRLIALLLTKHEKLYVIVADANHDPMGSIWTREWLHAHYENEPRVEVDLGADGYYSYEHGLTSLFFHHGHRRKPSNVDDVFVAKYRDLFGRTKFSYGHMGHLHHLDVKETNLMIVEQHRTMAAKDAYASRGGYMAGRDAKAITYHKQYGEVGRITITPEMLANVEHLRTKPDQKSKGRTGTAGKRKQAKGGKA